MKKLPVADRHKVGCSNCYEQGCCACGYRGWNESDEGREEREEHEDRRADARRKGEDE